MAGGGGNVPVNQVSLPSGGREGEAGRASANTERGFRSNFRAVPL